MQIKCNSVEGFLMNLDGQTVYRKTIYVSKSQVSLTDQPFRSATSIQVGIQLSAVIQHFDDDGKLEGDVLVECGGECGIDRTTGDGGLEGSEEFDCLLSSVVSFAKSRGLATLPGILGI